MRVEQLSKIIGQKAIKEKLNIFILPKITDNSLVEHILLDGKAGTGKTTIAKIIGGLNVKVVMGPSIKTKADLLAIFTNIEQGQFIFIDEIHRIDKTIEEVLYQIMDNFKISILIGKDGDSKMITFDIPQFTLIGATTLPGIMSNPFKDRFSHRFTMEEYDNEQIKQIIKQHIKYQIDIESLDLLSKNTKYIPRIAVNIANRVNDFVKFNKTDSINIEEIKKLLNILSIVDGLSQNDIKYLKILKINDGICGLENISKNMQVEKVNITNDIEPFLLANQYIKIEAKGRKITEKGLRILNEI